MDFNQIDIAPIKPGYGIVYQGNAVDAAIHSLPKPLAIVCMNRGEQDQQWIDHNPVYAVLNVWIEDEPDAVLPDDVLIGLVDAGLGLLKNGTNLYIHCLAGVSRASYYDIALHMRALNLSYGDAFELVKRQRTIICPNTGFVAHLQRLESRLRGN